MTITEFATFYRIPRRRVELAVTRALASNSGRFELPDLGAFQAHKNGDGRTALVTIEMLDVKEARRTLPPPPSASEIPPASSRIQSPSADISSSALLADPDLPDDLFSMSEHDLKRRHLAARIAALEQDSAEKRAKLRAETVAYCANSIQVLLVSLRAELTSAHLPPQAVATITSALNTALADLTDLIPDLIAGATTEQLVSAISARRAARLASASSEPHPEPEPKAPAVTSASSAPVHAQSEHQQEAPADQAQTEHPSEPAAPASIQPESEPAVS
ncbi:MAG: hypothetical protein IIZ51_06800 [Lachnospiraceae bacterium]|nr:hypothetical protein [Lachnospiraceae bacterium]